MSDTGAAGANRLRKIGILTGGGDCPGLNAVIRAVVTRAERASCEVMGIRGGWRGFLENDTMKLTPAFVADLFDQGGTVLGTTRVNPFQVTGGPERVHASFEAWRLDGLITVGGEGTMNLARLFHERGLPIVGVPKTIDNDLGGTEYTFGFDTAVTIATEAIDRLRTTAEAHERVMVVEVMGRHVGWIALHAGLAGGADIIVVPEKARTIADICNGVLVRRAQGQTFCIIVVAEGALISDDEGDEAHLVLEHNKPDAFGRPRLGGVGAWLARRIEEETGIESRVTVLGHVQRGGTPTARDRVLGTRYGVRAFELAQEDEFGQMVALKGDRIVPISLQEATRELKRLPEAWMELAGVFTT